MGDESITSGSKRELKYYKYHLLKINQTASELYHLGTTGVGISHALTTTMGTFRDDNSKLGGLYNENLDITLYHYDKISKACGLTMPEKRLGMIFKLKGNVLNFFNSKGRMDKTYEDGALTLRRQYNSRDKRSRIMSRWQTMRLSEDMAKTPDRSQMEVFLDFIADLVEPLKQLDSNYHVERYLTDQILNTFDVQSIQIFLRNRIPRTYDQAINRIANGLSDKRQTDGSTMAHWTNDAGQP